MMLLVIVINSCQKNDLPNPGDGGDTTHKIFLVFQVRICASRPMKLDQARRMEWLNRSSFGPRIRRCCLEFDLIDAGFEP